MNKYVLIAVTTILMVGCLKTRAELEAEESGQAQERQTVAQQRVAVRDGAAPAKEKAPPSAYRFEEYDEQMRTMSGRVDSLENAIQQLKMTKQNERELGSKDKQVTEQKFLVFEEALKKLEAQIAALNEEITRLKAPPPEPVAAPVVKGKANYDLGEEQFVQKKWKEAIVGFQKYRDQNPKGKYYSDATYKIGVCFQEIGMKDEARSFLEEVTAKFPNSKEAKKAAFRLKTLK